MTYLTELLYINRKLYKREKYAYSDNNNIKQMINEIKCLNVQH